MKKLLFSVFAIGIALITCVVPTYAAMYDLPDPTLVKSFGQNDWQRFFYRYDEDSSSYVPVSSFMPYPYLGSRFFSTWNGRNDSDAYDWALGDEWVAHDEIVNNQTDLDYITDYNNVLLTRIWGTSLRNTIIVPTYVQSGIYLPSDGQYLKITFSVTGFDRLNLSSSSETDIYNYNNLFLLYSSDGTSVIGTTLPPSTVVTTVSGRCTYYDVYFDYSDSAFSVNLDTGSPLSLAIRLPYSVAEDNYYDDPNLLVAYDFDYPKSYEILTIGGYEQDLNEIQTEIEDLTNTLVYIYTNQSQEDIDSINGAQDAFDEGKNVVNDYNAANDEVQQIVQNATVPDMKDIINNQVEMDADITSSFSELFQNVYIVSAFLICFGLCLISVLLYGIRS